MTLRKTDITAVLFAFAGEFTFLHNLFLNLKPKKLLYQFLLFSQLQQVSVGQPTVTGTLVTAEVIESDIQAEKLSSIRYQAKKRVHKVHSHRQHRTILRITKITR